MRLAMIALCGLTATACAMTPAPVADLGPPPADGAGLPNGQCFRSADIRNHTIADRDTMLLRVRMRDVYRVTVSTGCLAGALSTDPIITRQPPGAPIICRPIDMDLGLARVGGGGFETRCIVRSIVKLTPEQAAALPPKLRP
ncbi:MAG: DUF6491 family protein [Pseudomonadota bacterium]